MTAGPEGTAATGGAEAPVPATDAPATAADQGGATVLHDLRVVVDRIEGRPVCGLAPGDAFEITRSSRLTVPEGGHVCIYALAAVLPLLPAMQRDLAAGDWLAGENEVACPDPHERLVMRIERGPRRAIPTQELT